jgi:hypothetical protein
MTDTTSAPEQRTAAQVVDAWLADFNAALDDKDANAAAELFATASFWRDLISLTWNITTVEGPDGVRDMLEHTLLMLFADDPEFARSLAWSGACAAHGVYLHPVHNWFVGTAHDEATIDEVLERTDAAFDVVRDRFGAG